MRSGVAETGKSARDAVISAARALAEARDGSGYDEVDGPAVRCIIASRNPTARQIRSLWSILGKYAGRLEELGVDYGTLASPPEEGAPEDDVPTKIPLYPFQKVGVRWIEDHGGRALIADVMGLGKTPTALGYLAKNKEALPALVVCPANVRVTWYRETKKFTDLKPLLVSSRSNLEGFRKLGLDVSAAPDPGYDVSILNYDLLEAETPAAWAKELEAGDLSVEPLLLAAGRYAMRWLRARYEKAGDIEAKARILGVMRKIDAQGRGSNRRRFSKVRINGLDIEEFMAHGFGTIVCDEIHYIKDPRAQRTVAVHRMADAVRNRIGLTGTPLFNRTVEIWSQVYAVDRTVFPNFMAYARRYCDAKVNQVQVRGAKKGETREVWDLSGASNLAELEAVLRGRIMIRRTKEEVLKELPQKTRATVPILLDADELRRLNRECGPEMRELGTLARERREWREKLSVMGDHEKRRFLEAHAEEAARKNRLTGAALGKIEKVKQKIAAAKLARCADFIADAHVQRGKVVAFVSHHATSDSLLAALSRAGLEADLIDGRVEGPKREPVKDRFQQGDLDVLVCGIRAASEGLTLTASSTVAFVELDWSPARHLQAEDRVHRIGQAVPPNIYYLVAVGTLEERIAAMLDAKREVANAALGEAGRTAEEHGILDALLDEISGKEGR